MREELLREMSLQRNENWLVFKNDKSEYDLNLTIWRMQK